MELTTLGIPPKYCLEHDADVCVLRRSDGRMVAAFGAQESDPGAAEDGACGAEPDRSALRARFFGDFEVDYRKARFSVVGSQWLRKEGHATLRNRILAP